jgi:oligopeptide/dipeptide ABC transporter ATP-binding protein
MIRAFLRAPSGMASLFVLVLIAIVALLAPIFLQHAASTLDFTVPSQNPSRDHLLGTDPLGRDEFARVLVATRLSIGLGLLATLIAAVVGMSLGAATMLGGRIRLVLQRFIEAMMAFPALLVALLIAASLGPGLYSVSIGVGLALSIGFARVTSALSLSVGGREDILAARVLGLRGPRLLLRYVLPNIAETLLITSTVSISTAIIALSTLSFLGIGVQPPLYDWGGLLTEGVKAIYSTPAAAIGPALAISITALAFGFAGEAFARATNPLLWARGRGGRAASMLRPGGNGHYPTPSDSPSFAYADAILSVRALTVSFPGETGPLHAVEDVSFDLRPGERLGIVGESGSGKTMTAMAIAQLLPPGAGMEGTVRFKGKDLETLPPAEVGQLLGTTLAVVFQDPMSSLNPALRVGIQLTEAAEVNRNLDRGEAREVALSRLREVNLPVPRTQLNRYPHELSGGMRQRVMTAMGLMNEPELLIADEPTTALDVTIQAQIMELLRGITQSRHMALIFISHNLALVGQFCDRVIVMYTGRVVEDLTTDQLLAEPLHPYTKALVAAIPDLGRPREDRFSTIPGRPPDLTARPSGCPFHPRCPVAQQRCTTDLPPLLARADGRRVACWVANADMA